MGLPTEADEMGLLRVAAALEELTTLEVANVVALAGKAVPTPALIPVGPVDLLHVASERPGALDDRRTDFTMEQGLGGGRPVSWSLARDGPHFLYNLGDCGHLLPRSGSRSRSVGGSVGVSIADVGPTELIGRAAQAVRVG